MENENVPRQFECVLSGQVIKGVVTRKYYMQQDYLVEVRLNGMSFAFDIIQTSPTRHSVGYIKYPKSNVNGITVTNPAMKRPEMVFMKVEDVRQLPVEVAFEEALKHVYALYRSLRGGSST